METKLHKLAKEIFDFFRSDCYLAAKKKSVMLETAEFCPCIELKFDVSFAYPVYHRLSRADATTEHDDVI